MPMEIKEAIVANENGAITGTTIIGKAVPVGSDPYSFYIQKPSGTNDVPVVSMVMPLGGQTSGIYRFPRVGEKVLIAFDSGTPSKKYLLGYLPGQAESADSIYPQYAPIDVSFLTTEKQGELNTAVTSLNTEEKNKLTNADAMIFRFKKRGANSANIDEIKQFSDLQTRQKKLNADKKKLDDEIAALTDSINNTSNPDELSSLNNSKSVKQAELNPINAEIDNISNMIPKEKYSEIAFYRGTSEWPKTDKDVDFIAIDQLHLKSTGDIKQKAANHNQIRAKRFELLVNCEKPIHNKADLTKDELPLGDKPGDDSVLHAGDAHIRASRRVVIKAGDSITLQAGRTLLTINDDGLTIKSKHTNSNFVNAYDATLNVNPKGISLFGLDVNISGVRSAGFADAFGGSASSRLGAFSIGGREIKMETIGLVPYSILVGYAAGLYAQSTVSGSMAVDGSEQVKTAEYMKYTIDTLKKGVDLVKNIVDIVNAYNDLQVKKEQEAAKKAETKKREEADKAKKAAEEAKKLADEAKVLSDKAKNATSKAEAEKYAAEARQKETEAGIKLAEATRASEKAASDNTAAQGAAVQKEGTRDTKLEAAKQAQREADAHPDDAAKKQAAKDASTDAQAAQEDYENAKAEADFQQKLSEEANDNKVSAQASYDSTLESSVETWRSADSWGQPAP